MFHSRARQAGAVLLLSALVGCGGGGSDTTAPTPPTPPPPPPTPTASIALSAPAATVQAGGSTPVAVTLTRGGGYTGEVTVAVTGAPAGVTAATQTIAAGATSATLTIATTSAAAPAVAALSVTGTGTGVTIAPQSLALSITAPAAPITQLGTDIANPDLYFGHAIALSADGARMVVGAYGATNGTTRVYQRSGADWTQLGADIVGEAADDRSGISVDINAAGTRIAVGSYLNDGGGANSGHVRVFDLVGTTWTQTGADLDGDAAGHGLGWSVALSASGNRVIAGGPGVGGTTGRFKVWELEATSWRPLGPTISAGNEFGEAVAMSGDGSRVAVGAPSGAGGSRSGSVQVYGFDGTTWAPVGSVISGKANGDNAGAGIALSTNGSRIAVSSPANRDGGVSGGGSPAGQVRVFDLVGATWTQVGGDVNGTTGLNGENLGESLSMSDDGARFVASGSSQNVARVFSLVGGAWVQTGANISSTLSARPEGVALSPDGRTVAAGFVNGTPRRVRVFSVSP